MVCGQGSDSQITKNFASTVGAKLLKYYYFCHFTFHEERIVLVRWFMIPIDINYTLEGSVLPVRLSRFLVSGFSGISEWS